MANTNTQIHDEAAQITLGSIVALKSHPYPSSKGKVIISGDTTHISPFMIVIEIQKNWKIVHDEHTGVKLDAIQLKCLFYSNKDQFEEVWLSSSLLKIIKKKEAANFIDSRELIDLKRINETFLKKQVVISTLELELGKKKSYLRVDSDNVDNRKIKIEGLLTYLSPVMQVTEIKKYDQKDALYDIKSGEPKRFVSTWVAKCKWFNSDSGKYHEKFISVDALDLLPVIRSSTIEDLQSHILNRSYISIEKNDESTRIIAPKNIYYRSGFYYLEYFDYISNRLQESKIQRNDRYTNIVENYYIEKYPIFDFQNGLVTTSLQRRSELLSAISRAAERHNFLRIEYKNYHDILTTRTLKNFEVITIEDDGEQIQYLVGYCHLRKETRTFRIDRIKKLEVLNAKYE